MDFGLLLKVIKVLNFLCFWEMKFYYLTLNYYFFILLIKFIIFGWDVTFGIKPMVFKRFLGLGEVA